MSRKDYIATAKIITDARDQCINVHAATDQIAMELALLFRRDNERFDRSKFLRACGVK